MKCATCGIQIQADWRSCLSCSAPIDMGSLTTAADWSFCPHGYLNGNHEDCHPQEAE